MMIGVMKNNYIIHYGMPRRSGRYKWGYGFSKNRFPNLAHSAKGSTWEKHKYIKRLDGTYYYPDSYEGGRHLPDGEKKSEENGETESSEISKDDVEKLASEVIRGNFGNGQIRKDLLGENYQKIQDRVNELLKTNIGNLKVEDVVSEKSDIVEKGNEEIKKAVSSSASKGIDMEKVLSVYRKKSA